MTDNVHLIGADDVRAAGYRMREAAETMSQAAMTIDGSVDRLKMFLDDWLIRFEAAIERTRDV